MAFFGGRPRFLLGGFVFAAVASSSAFLEGRPRFLGMEGGEGEGDASRGKVGCGLRADLRGPKAVVVGTAAETTSCSEFFSAFLAAFLQLGQNHLRVGKESNGGTRQKV